MAAKRPKPPCTYGCNDGKRLVRHSGTGEHHTTRCMCTYDDLPVQLVLQPEPKGCMIAAVATVVGKTYEEVLQLVDRSHDFTQEGTHQYVIEGVLEHLGWAVQVRQRWQGRLGGTHRDPWPCAPWADLHICQVRNLPDNAEHAVVLLRDGRVLDPWWGVVQGLHRYKSVSWIMACYNVSAAAAKPKRGKAG